MKLKQAKHASIEGHNFVPHSDPVPLSTFHEVPAHPQIAQVNTTHEEKLRLWIEQQVVTREIKHQLVNVFDAIYVMELRDNHAVHNNATIPETIERMHKHYGYLD